MACPSFLRRKLTYGIGNKILAPSGGVVYPPSDIQYYYEFNGVDSYIEVSGVILSGESRKITFTIQSTSISSDQAIIACESFSGNEGYVLLYLDAPNGLDLLVGTSTGFSRATFGGLTDICNGEVNTVEVDYDSGSVSAYLNGDQIGSSFTLPTLDWILTNTVNGDNMHLFGNSRYFDGIPVNVNMQGVITTNGQTYSELNYPIIFDNIGDTIVRETVNGDGPELVVNGDASDGINSWNGSTSILSVENGRFRLDNSATYQSVNQTFATVAGASYVVNGGLDVGTADGYYQIRDGSGVIIAESVSLPTIVTAQTDSMTIRLHTGTAVGTCYFSNVSVKQTLDGQLINAQDADYIEV